jgi:hypothetical protein
MSRRAGGEEIVGNQGKGKGYVKIKQNKTK